jgi:ADP-ribosyl-[dinitrogen reductase] hydrolase
VTLYSGSGTPALTLDFILAEKNRTPKGSGYVVDSLWSARAACREESYEEVVKSAIAFGHDTDTTACIAGGLAGVHFGFDAIPLKWTDGLRGRDLVKQLEQQLLRRG